MKCINPSMKCKGEMSPLYKSAHLTECDKCGYRIDTPKQEPKKAPVKEVEVKTELKKETD